eukprot:TRINITY_DN4306_c0_g1_i1.p1 TRINITY_DN4306_c0_g1~~TRINITY_DN4306_c0_g1_i1.p1  ORF type:complete len:179 (+),score=42.92 TRINITY_DN4306_c0_g1_i1:43-579(+)
MFNWLVGRFVRKPDVENVGDSAEETMESAEVSLNEIISCIKKAEAELSEIEEREESLKEEGEKLMMQSHDEIEGAISTKGQKLLETEVAKTIAHVSRHREAHELKILNLEIRKAALLGEQLKAQELLRDLGRTDPLQDIAVPAYPGRVVCEPNAEEEQEMLMKTPAEEIENETAKVAC